jgi:transposase
MRDQWGMSNVLTVSLRRIARELGIDRETVGRYLLLAKTAISIAGVDARG